MKTTNNFRLAGVAFATCPAAVLAFGLAMDHAEAVKGLVTKHDLNGDGKIDAGEHKEFARARPRLLRAKARRLGRAKSACRILAGLHLTCLAGCWRLWVWHRRHSLAPAGLPAASKLLR